jgi:hypothetical protein
LLEEFAANRSPQQFDPSHGEALYVLLTSSFAHRLGLDAELTDIKTSVQGAYAGLLRRGLVEDPFFLVPDVLHAIGNVPHLASVGIALLGLVPTEFGVVTEEGKITSLKIKSLYVDYERKIKGIQVSTQLHFRVLQLAKTFINAARIGLDALDGKHSESSSTKMVKGKKVKSGTSKGKRGNGRLKEK